VSRGLVESAAVVPAFSRLSSEPLTNDSVVQLASILDAQLFLLRTRQLAASMDNPACALLENAV
jgi:hypothetical protein